MKKGLRGINPASKPRRWVCGMPGVTERLVVSSPPLCGVRAHRMLRQFSESAWIQACESPAKAASLWDRAAVRSGPQPWPREARSAESREITAAGAASRVSRACPVSPVDWRDSGRVPMSL
jgi:hypothetical protein